MTIPTMTETYQARVPSHVARQLQALRDVAQSVAQTSPDEVIRDLASCNARLFARLSLLPESFTLACEWAA